MQNACKTGIHLEWEKVSCLERCPQFSVCPYIGPQFRGVYTHREVPLFAKVRISNTAMHSTVCVCHTVNALGKLVSGNMEPTTTELSLPMHGVHEHMCI